MGMRVREFELSEGALEKIIDAGRKGAFQLKKEFETQLALESVKADEFLSAVVEKDMLSFLVKWCNERQLGADTRGGAITAMRCVNLVSDAESMILSDPDFSKAAKIAPEQVKLSYDKKLVHLRRIGGEFKERYDKCFIQISNSNPKFMELYQQAVATCADQMSADDFKKALRAFEASYQADRAGLAMRRR
jgi:hypothetical protein